MKLRLFGGALCAILLLPAALHAQDATVIGAIKDSTDAVLPGVTVTALNLENGNTFVDVTDGAGNYRLALRPGFYKISADLPGFTTAVRERVELQIGRRTTLDLRLSLSGVAESVTVTGEAPLVDVSSSRIGGVIDRRQVEDLPVNGRNFIDLSMLAPGSRANHVIESASPRTNSGTTEVHINVDGQQVTTMASAQDSWGNPRYSKDSIAEFEVITNRFDATQGKSSAGQVNAITKSGTNRFAGSVSGYFRDDSLNAADHIVNRVLPYQDQQVSTTFGGPIIKDRFHFFANYEYERTPQTKVFTTPYALFNQEDLQTDDPLYTTGIKFDYQFNPQVRAMVKGFRYYKDIPVHQAGGSSVTVSAANSAEKSADSLFGSLTQTFGARGVNEVRGGYSSFYSLTAPYVERDRFVQDFEYRGAPRINLNGLSFGGPSNTPQRWVESRYSLRDDLTLLFSKGGRHELKLGGEYFHHNFFLIWLHDYRGTLTATAGSIPANVEQLFPNQYDWRTWNLAPLSPLSIRWTQSFGDRLVDGPGAIHSAWVQDTWTVTPRLTLNLGLRYEIAPDQLNEDAIQAPFIPTERHADRLGFAPRVGSAYNFNDGRTVIRGGFGKYISQSQEGPQWGSDISISTRVPSTPNDGRPNFAGDPYNGPPPSVAEVFARVGDITIFLPSADLKLSYSWQSSAGVQHQLTDTMSFEADWVWQGGRREWESRNLNLSYDENGVNYPFTDAARRPFPDWGVVRTLYSDADSDYHALQTGFTKRFSNNWQANATYSLAALWDRTACPREGLGRRVENCPRDIGGERSLGVTDQRHRATANGIVSLPWGFQISGLYFYGSGMRYNTVYGGDRRLQGSGQSGRLGPGGVIAPRNGFVGQPIHRVDMRILKRVNLSGARQLDGIIEVFNVFNHANYGSYATNLSVARTYGRPQQNINVAYAPRIVQLGFRFVF